MLSRQEERDLLMAALLHDIGKSQWPVSWHVEPKHKLGTNALTVIQAHPLVGANMAYEAGVPESVVNIIRQHHERPGGRGIHIKWSHRYRHKFWPLVMYIVLARRKGHTEKTFDGTGSY